MKRIETYPIPSFLAGFDLRIPQNAALLCLVPDVKPGTVCVSAVVDDEASVISRRFVQVTGNRPFPSDFSFGVPVVGFYRDADGVLAHVFDCGEVF